MLRRADKDVISQVELRKGADFTIGTTPAIHFVRELYMHALERRLADGALIEPGSLTFHTQGGVVCRKKDAATETRVEAAGLHFHSM